MRKLLLTTILAASCWSGMGNAALTLSADRLVYNEKDGDASITIHSNEDRAYLVQSWLDAGDSTVKKDLPFVVTPPLFRLAPKSDNVIRIVYLGNGLPADRESLFWLDVKGVPGLTDEESKVENRMVLAINNRIKFFFRPAGLKGDPGEGVKNAHWIHSGNKLTVKNASPYYLVFSKIIADKESIKVSVVDNNTVIPPFGEKSYTLKHAPASGSTVEWDGINDFGVTSQTYSQHLE
ncbi:molecular chaperone [Cronobacter sakazakii]|uniref:fimbrial biogenesis chaperone n=3 Tax=Cronobacter sakazakii TaxID=28141 RepID=UPI0009416374|nr:molecular chaperone [Cronobacter sakazakii]AZP35502.1 molecular chaperone [Cronobacter sakazakii]EKK4013096.1 molecular chaperone [Cronobacter sakazakii]ELY2595660.1 molecular chaperone [Cronobacter sakazakii]ELY3419703.1 molecular chaperone [Cronobacter sakazakii]ELY4032964.1 molecular chaperone [Cronobacter sakazakii]